MLVAGVSSEVLVVRQGFFEQLTALDWAHRYCQNFG